MPKADMLLVLLPFIIIGIGGLLLITKAIYVIPFTKEKLFTTGAHINIIYFIIAWLLIIIGLVFPQLSFSLKIFLFFLCGILFAAGIALANYRDDQEFIEYLESITDPSFRALNL